MQFDTTINDWHTCPNTGRINASNPCSEYMHLDDSRLQPGVAEPDAVRRRRPATSTSTRSATRSTSLITAQDIVVDNSSYPTPEIDRRTRTPSASSGSATPTWARCSCRSGSRTTRRPGAQYAGAVTALMCGEAYLPVGADRRRAGAVRRATRRTASRMLRVIEKHRAQAHKLDPALVPLDLLRAAREAWDEALRGRRASTASATRRRRCSRRPAPSRS